MKLCSKCFYYGELTKTCDYLLLAGHPRGCSVEDCNRFRDWVDKRKIIFARRDGYKGDPMPEDKKPLALELYRQGFVDVEIATKLHLHPQQVNKWRTQRGLASNYIKGEKE